MKKTTVQKLLSMALVAAMLFTLAVPAFAARVGGSGGQGRGYGSLGVETTSLTLTKQSENDRPTAKIRVTYDGRTDSLSWRSSNTDVAEVRNDGTVIGKKVGTATITIESPYNERATCDVKVVMKGQENDDLSLGDIAALGIATGVAVWAGTELWHGLGLSGDDHPAEGKPQGEAPTSPQPQPQPQHQSSNQTDAKASKEEQEYSPVYDYAYYRSTYPELQKKFGDNRLAYLNYFLSTGMMEGQRGCADFDVRVYRSRYPDLKQAFGDNLTLYYKHYIEHGRAEGRSGK